MAVLPIHGYAAAALQMYKDKEVEINTGETQTTLIFSDWESELKHVVRGVLRDAIGDALVVECKTRFGVKTILINAWSVVAITLSTKGTPMKDMYTDEHSK